VGLLTTVTHFREQGSPALRVAFLAWAFLGFGLGVVLWLRPVRPRPRIVPYFARRIDEYGAPTAAALRRADERGGARRGLQAGGTQ
jgi:hypothetical protein